MNHLVSLVLLGVCFEAATAAQRCAGNTPENGIVQKGAYWYMCSRGRLEPKGCIHQNRRVNLDQPYKENDKEVTCRKGADGYLMFEQTACYLNGYRINPEAVYESEDTWFVCERVGKLYLYLKPAGCMDRSQRVYFHERKRNDGQITECNRHAKRSYMRVIGCMIDNREYMIGDRFQDNEYLYTCELENENKAIRKVIGCVNDGQTYYDYQIYHKASEIYRCEVKPGRVGAEHKICGCVDKLPNRPPLEKLIGCQWVHDEERLGESYLMQCRLEGGKAIVERIRCLYQSQLGYHMEIIPNCFRPIYGTKNAVGCHRDPVSQILYTKLFPQDDFSVQLRYNVRYC